MPRLLSPFLVSCAGQVVPFQAALKGRVQSNIEIEDNGQRLIEAYLPIIEPAAGKVVTVLEIYEDVTRFEEQVMAALKKTLVLPTIVFVVFNVVLFILVARADRIIVENTMRMIKIRSNMEKYLSSSAVTAICQAVSEKKELFTGERQELVVMFSNIRGFTVFSEGTEPERVVRFGVAPAGPWCRRFNKHEGGVVSYTLALRLSWVFGLEEVDARSSI